MSIQTHQAPAAYAVHGLERTGSPTFFDMNFRNVACASEQSCRVECVWHSTTLRHRVHRYMPDYRRNRVAGGTCFFTVGPVVGGMQRAFHPTQHMHALWTLPEGDADFPRADGRPSRWHSRSGSRQGRRCRQGRRSRENAEFGSAGIGSTRSGMTGIMQPTWITFISIR